MPTTAKLPKKKSPTPENGVPNDRVIRYITFFGDSALAEDHPVYQDIFHLAQALAKKGYGIVNGGGPGVMQAATSGAESVNGHTTAVYWEPKLASHFEGRSFTNVTDESETYSNYLMRTLGLIEKGQVFIACQGGTGTVSEFGMVWALAKMYFGKHKPLILYGDFWHKVLNSIIDNMLIDDEEKGVLYFASTKEEVLELLHQFENEIQARQQRFVHDGDENAFVIDSRSHITRHEYDRIAKMYHKERAGKLVSQEQLDEFMELVGNPGGLVLDIGCGPGYDLGYLTQKYKLHGLDISKEMVKIARYENPEAQIIWTDVLNADLGSQIYDGIWSRDTFHHIAGTSQDWAWKKVAKSLKPGGIFYIIVQEGEGEQVMHEKRVEYAMKRFYHYYSVEELEKLARKHGFEVVKLHHVRRSHNWLAAALRKT